MMWLSRSLVSLVTQCYHNLTLLQHAPWGSGLVAMRSSKLHMNWPTSRFDILKWKCFCVISFVLEMEEIKVSPDYNWFRSSVPLKRVSNLWLSSLHVMSLWSFFSLTQIILCSESWLVSNWVCFWRWSWLTAEQFWSMSCVYFFNYECGL